MSRIRRLILIGVPVVTFPLLFVYDVIRATVDLEVPSLNYVREILLALAFVLLAFALEGRKEQATKGPPKEIGQLLLFSFLTLVIVGILTGISSISANHTTPGSSPRFALDLFVTHGAGVVAGIWSLLALRTLRHLVMFKRRRGVWRNFNLYVGLLVGSSVSAVQFFPLRDYVSTTLYVLALMMGVVVSFKQNWIVYLSRKEKIYSIAYSALGFLVILGLELFLSRRSGGTRGLEAFSLPVQNFVQLNGIFSLVYFGMAFVSTLFHLPTAEVFERKQQELNSLHNLSRLITQVFDFSDLVQTVTQMTLEVCDAKTAWLEILREDPQSGGKVGDIVSKRNISQREIDTLNSGDGQSLRKAILDSQRVLLIEDLWSDRRTRHLKESKLLRGSLLCVPLTTHGELIGILHATKDIEDTFDQDDIDVMTTFADNVTIAIENSKLIARSLERERLQQEMMVAQRMQQRLLPQKMPEVRSADFAAVSASSTEVGGDYYDFVELADERVGITVGDVSGKGVSAAFYMAEVKGIFLSLSKICASPRELLVRANHTLMQSLERNAFISLIYAILDTRNGTLLLARAGHCPAIYLSGEICEQVRPTGLGLGLTDGKEFEEATQERTLRLKPGDVCLMYTDGITESRNALGEEFGYDRLVESAKLVRDRTAVEIKEHVIQAVRSFSSSEASADDMTLVVIKWNGTR